MKRHLKDGLGAKGTLKTVPHPRCDCGDEGTPESGAAGTAGARTQSHSHPHDHNPVHGHSHTHGTAAELLENAHVPPTPEEIARRQRNLRLLGGVLALNVGMMIAEVGVGLWASSSALTVDGWHMLGHTVALGLTFIVMRKILRGFRGRAVASAGVNGAGTASDPGAGLADLVRLERRAGLANAILLVLLGAFTIFDALRKFSDPHVEDFAVALSVAVGGLVVNVWGGWLLHDSHDHGNVAERGMYLHILSDALMSCLAIVALSAAAWVGWHWADPAVGVLGGLVILKWGASLVAQGLRA